MVSKTFVDKQQPVVDAAWLNDVDALVYEGTVLSPAATRSSLGLTAASGASLVGFSAAGGTSRTVEGRLRETFSVKDFGAVGDGVTDDSAAIQAAHDALPNLGGELFFPPSSNPYLVNTTCAFTKPVTMTGGDYESSLILATGNGVVAFTTTRKLVIQGMRFDATGAASGTAVAVKTLNSVAASSNTLLFNSLFSGFARAYWSQRTISLRVMHCYFGSCGYGLYLENVVNSDEGDSFIHDNYFAGDAVGTVSILVASTSGINIANNKFNGAIPVHLDVVATSNNVGNFLLSNNSFEGHVTAAVRLIATSGTIVKTLIHGNQFSSGSATHIIVGQGAKHTAITGNIFNDINPANGVGIDIQSSSLNTSIVGNLFHQIATAIKSVSAITGQTIKSNRFLVSGTGSENVTTMYLGGEDVQSLSSSGSEKDFELDRLISNDSNSSYVNAVQLKGDCVLEVWVMGIVQGAGTAWKYRKVLVSADTTVTDLTALVSVGSAFDLQIAASGGFTVVGIKRNGATGTSVTMQVRVRATGYVRDFSKV